MQKYYLYLPQLDEEISEDNEEKETLSTENCSSGASADKAIVEEEQSESTVLKKTVEEDKKDINVISDEELEAFLGYEDCVESEKKENE